MAVFRPAVVVNRSAGATTVRGTIVAVFVVAAAAAAVCYGKQNVSSITDVGDVYLVSYPLSVAS